MKSRSKRLKQNPALYPAPGKYNIPRDLLKRKPFKINGPMSSFAKTVRRKEINIMEKEKVKKKLMEGETKFKEYRGKSMEVPPGPGDFESAKAKDHLFDAKPASRKGMSSFQPGRKRFKMDRDKVANPGPGRYNMASDFKGDRYRVCGAVFMSESDRNAFDIKKLNGRFAVFDEKMKPTKTSFNKNLKSNFIV